MRFENEGKWNDFKGSNQRKNVKLTYVNDKLKAMCEIPLGPNHPPRKK